MNILGIESSCDETAAAVVRDGRRVLSSVVASQHETHAEYSGVVPELASRAHVEKILPIVRAALEEAGVGLGMIDAIAVGHRPGLIGCLLIGVAAAKSLAWSLGRPLVGVDHVHAHLYAGALESEATDRAATGPTAPGLAAIELPALGLVVSGGHTSVYLVHSWTRLERLGATIDDALGEAYDKVAATLGLSFPGGPALDRLASRDGARDDAYGFPVSRLAPDSLDFSFSGLKTAVLYAVHGVPGERGGGTRGLAQVPEDERRDIAASFQRAASRAVVLKLDRALDRATERLGRPPRTLLCGGGVVANSRLRRELSAFAAERSLALRLPAMHYCVDNAATIAGLGFPLLREGHASDLTLRAVPTTAT